MRNWNNKTYILPVSSLNRFYLTYEELKLGLDMGHTLQGAEILSYLWGIETRIRVVHIYSYTIDFILPMRNWNQAITKEEYKKICGILSYLWGIETHIPGLLKGIGKDFILPMRNWNNFLTGDKDLGLYDFILPMRNWNRRIRGTGKRDMWDFILPMRNWNLV